MESRSSQHEQTLQNHKDRNLANQRNYRKRRQQYVAELEAKVRDYDAAELQASMHVQEAARLVSHENAILRKLIQTSMGWNQQQLNQYITANTINSASSLPPGRDTKSISVGSVTSHSQQPTSREDCLPLQTDDEHYNSGYTGTDFETTMTCEQAASIILELGTQGSADTIRGRLGCNSGSSCKVSHNHVFQVMETCI